MFEIPLEQLEKLEYWDLGSYSLELSVKEGFLMLAPESYWMATEDEIAEHTGGCGPGKIGDAFVPDTAWGESIFLACQIHDWMYFTGNTSLDKQIADLVFMVNMMSLILEVKGGLDPARIYRAATYFNAVYFAGGDAFEKEG